MAENVTELSEEEKRKLVDDLLRNIDNPYTEDDVPTSKEDISRNLDELLRQMNRESPASQVLDLTTQAVSAGYGALPEPIQSGIEATGQGAKVAGSKFMELLKPIDKPRGALAGAWEALGPEEASVMDDRSMARRIWEGMGQGWRERRTSERIAQVYQDWGLRVRKTNRRRRRRRRRWPRLSVSSV